MEEAWLLGNLSQSPVSTSETWKNSAQGVFFSPALLLHVTQCGLTAGLQSAEKMPRCHCLTTHETEAQRSCAV